MTDKKLKFEQIKLLLRDMGKLPNLKWAAAKLAETDRAALMRKIARSESFSANCPVLHKILAEMEADEELFFQNWEKFSDGNGLLKMKRLSRRRAIPAK